MYALILYFHTFKVYLAMEAGYMEKVDELCERYSLDRFLDIKGKAVSCDQHKFIKEENIAVYRTHILFHLDCWLLIHLLPQKLCFFRSFSFFVPTPCRIYSCLLVHLFCYQLACIDVATIWFVNLFVM